MSSSKIKWRRPKKTTHITIWEEGNRKKSVHVEAAKQIKYRTKIAVEIFFLFVALISVKYRLEFCFNLNRWKYYDVIYINRIITPEFVVAVVFHFNGFWFNLYIPVFFYTRFFCSLSIVGSCSCAAKKKFETELLWFRTISDHSVFLCECVCVCMCGLCILEDNSFMPLNTLISIAHRIQQHINIMINHSMSQDKNLFSVYYHHLLICFSGMDLIR